MGDANGNKKKATSASAWKKQAQGAPLDVPSGNTALVRPVGMQVFMQRGMIPNSLMPWVQSAIKGEEVKMTFDDFSPEQISDLMDLVDAVTCYCVVEPKVSPVPKRLVHGQVVTDGKEPELEPIPVEDREGDNLWVDEVDFDDKMFIYQFVVGGTRDVAQFRAEQAAGMESLRAGSDMAVPTK